MEVAWLQCIVHTLLFWKNTLTLSRCLMRAHIHTLTKHTTLASINIFIFHASEQKLANKLFNWVMAQKIQLFLLISHFQNASIRVAATDSTTCAFAGDRKERRKKIKIKNKSVMWNLCERVKLKVFHCCCWILLSVQIELKEALKVRHLLFK